MITLKVLGVVIVSVAQCYSFTVKTSQSLSKQRQKKSEILACSLFHLWFVHRQIKVEFSMKFTSRDLSLKRTPSKKQSGVFGVKINVVTK